MRLTRPISWVKGALRDYQAFPLAARSVADAMLTGLAEGETPDGAKPLIGFGSGVWELVIRSRGEAYRVVYALQIADAIWIIHAFQKKSKSGIATPKPDIDLVRERLKRLKERL